MASIEKHGDKYRGVYTDATGKRHKTPVVPTKTAARKAAEQEQSRVRGGTWIDPAAGKILLQEYVEDPHVGWMRLRRGERTTKDGYATLWNQIKPALGKIELRKINSSVVQAWVNELEEGGTSPTTIRARFKFLQTVLAAKRGVSAMRDGLIATNPCFGVDLPHVPHREVTIYEPHEYERLLKSIPSYWVPLVFFSANTGLRWGELMGLRVSDFEPGYVAVRVQRTVVETAIRNTSNGTRFVWKPWPKAKRSRRVALPPEVQVMMADLVSVRGLAADDRVFSAPGSKQRPRRVNIVLTPTLVASLDAFVAPNGATYGHGTINGYTTGKCRCGHCRQAASDYRYRQTLRQTDQAPERSEAWPEGVPVSRSWFRTAIWMPAHQAAGMGERRFHDLRASHISWLLAMGLDLPTVMERAGHRGFETTQRYTRALGDADRRVLQAIELFRDGGS